MTKIDASSGSNSPLTKVPQVTLIFWVIKLLSTTVGESFADYLSGTLKFGLLKTTWVMGLVMIGLLIWQILGSKYSPSVYWLTVVSVSIGGTLLTDTLTDKIEFPLIYSSSIFAIFLIMIFALWYQSEKTIEMKSINSRKREIYYWSAILTTFALGTAAGDLVSEEIGLGYAKTALLTIGIISLLVFFWKVNVLTGVAIFWPTYILTRPLGASLGDYLTQSKAHGGLNLGPTLVSFVFLAVGISLVTYLSISKSDQFEKTAIPSI